MPLEYHTSTGRLVLHGGAADGWFADTFTLDVATVVGPPYAIAAVTPPMGPITGGTLLEISGVDFIKTSDVVVRFALGKHWRIEVQGSFVNQSLITCLSPDFTIPVDGQEGAWPRKDPVEVRVSLGGQSFTTTRALFTFFPVTEALRCFAYGPGLLCNGLVEKETCFIIQAMDGSNIPRTSGGDEFQVNILYRSSAGGSETKESDWSEDDDEDNDSEVDGVAHGADTSPTMKIRSHLQDLGDGTYRVRYLPLAAGTYEIAVRFLGTFGGKPGVVRGFPCVSSFVRDVDPENNSLSGPLMLQAAKDYASSLLTWASEVKEKLRVANPGASGKWDFDVLVAAKKATQTFSDELDGMILVSDRCQAMLDEMDRAMVSVPAACTQQLARARAIITDLVGQMPEVDARLAPAIKAAAPRVKQAISSMERDLDAFVGALKMAKFTIWETGLEGAHESLSDARTIALEKEKSLQSVDAMAQLFGLSSELAASRLLLAEMNDDIVAYLGLWQSAQSFSEVVSFCGSLRWIDVNPEGLEESAKTALSNILRLPAKVRPSGAFDGLLSKVRSFSGECALASSLFRAQLAPRHWTRLQAATNATALLGGADMVLQELFRLDLAAHVQDVELIVDRAGAESKHAEALALMNERWSTMQWDIHATAVEGGLNLSAESRSVLEVCC
jgi:dynein heavy chain